MNRFAKVESLDALKELRTFLPTLERRMTVALEEADFDMQKTLNWLRDQQYPYWKGQQTKRSEEYLRAKMELNRKRYLEKSPIGGQYSYIDQKKAMAAAQKRLEQAQDKLHKISKWVPALEKEIYECKASLQGLANLIQIDLPNKRNQIDQMIYSLEAYTSLTAPSIGQATEAQADTAQEMTRPVEPVRVPDEFAKLNDQLRERNPLNKITLNIPARKPEGLFEIKNDPAVKLLSGKIIKSEPDQQETVIYDNLIESSDFIYVLNLNHDKDAKMQSYIGPVKQKQTANYSSCHTADVIKSYPAWKNVFLLPENWLTVFKDEAVYAVFDDNDNLVYRLDQKL